MKMKYLLTKSEPRAETTDTIILFECAERGALEEIVLSTWEETEYEIFNYMLCTCDESAAMKTAKTVAKNFAEEFQINVVYEIDP